MGFAWGAAAGGLGAAGSIYEGIQNRNFSRDMFNNNVNFQKEMAQNALGWRVEDAKRAGLHPLAALGANVASGAPISVGTPSSGMAMASQHISRAMEATMSKRARMENRLNEAALVNSNLKNELLASQVQAAKNPSPAYPSQYDQNVLGGQGDSTAGPMVIDVPLQRTKGSSFTRGREVGSVEDYGLAKTAQGFAIVPSKDVKERVEDQLIPELMWALRNQIKPFFKRPKAPSSREFPAGKGKVWKWNKLKQEFRPVNAPWNPKMKGANMRRRN